MQSFTFGFLLFEPGVIADDPHRRISGAFSQKLLSAQICIVAGEFPRQRRKEAWRAGAYYIGEDPNLAGLYERRKKLGNLRKTKQQLRKT